MKIGDDAVEEVRDEEKQANKMMDVQDGATDNLTTPNGDINDESGFQMQELK